MLRQQLTGWTLVMLVSVTQFLPVLTHPGGGLVAVNGPQQPQYQHQQHHQQQQQLEARKFAEKPNAMKKVAIDNDLDDVSTNQISDSFSWSNLLSMVMQMLFNPSPQGPNKSEGLDNEAGLASSPWANILSMGLKILTAILGGGSGGDGIDKVDNSSPMQFIGLVVNLLDALKTSFSHRSISARALGKKDSTEAAAAGIAILKVMCEHTKRRTIAACRNTFAKPTGNALKPQSVEFSVNYLHTPPATLWTDGADLELLTLTMTQGDEDEAESDCQQLFLTCNEV